MAIPRKPGINVGELSEEDVSLGAGAVADGTQRVTLGSDDPAVAALTSLAAEGPHTSITEPSSDIADTTGIKIGPLAVGRWVIQADQRVYFRRGAAAMVVGDVGVDEATPAVSRRLFGGGSYRFDVTGATDNYICARTATGTSLVVVSPE